MKTLIEELDEDSYLKSLVKKNRNVELVQAVKVATREEAKERRLYSYDYAKREYDDTISAPEAYERRIQQWHLSSKYESLSYAWEGQTPTQPIACDNRELLVTRNVDTLLRHLRLPDQTRQLWIDSVCIDQNNPEEQAEQVKYMHLIYKQAERVLVWLGGSQDYGESVIESLLQIRGEETIESIQRKFEVATGDSSLQPLQNLLLRSWFYRRWTIQEVVLGCRVSMICGTVSIDFDHFYGALHQLYSIWKSGTLNESEVFERLRLIYHLRKHGLLTHRADLLRLLITFHEAQCSLSVDRINSLSALGSGYGFDRFRISYITQYTIYFRLFAQNLIDGGLLPTVLSCAGAFPSKSSAIPSWVPDWQEPRCCLPLHVDDDFPIYKLKWVEAEPSATKKMEMMIGLFSAQPSLNLFYHPLAHNSPRIPEIQGLAVGMIRRTGDAASSDPSVEELISLVEKWWFLYKEDATSVNTSSFLTALSAGKIRPDGDTMVFDVSDGIFGKLGRTSPSRDRARLAFVRDLRPTVSIEVASGQTLHHITTVLQSSGTALLRPAGTSTSVPSSAPAVVPTLPTPASAPYSHAIARPKFHAVSRFVSQPSTHSKVVRQKSGRRLLDRLVPKASRRKASSQALAIAQKDHSLIQILSTFTEEEMIKLFYILRIIMGGRCFFLAENGGFGIAPASATTGDVLVDITGRSTYIVLRQLPKNDPLERRYFHLVGDCHLQMPGEPNGRKHHMVRNFALR
jgi:hypothetical protein